MPVATSITFAFAWLFTALIYKRLPTNAKWIMSNTSSGCRAGAIGFDKIGHT